MFNTITGNKYDQNETNEAKATEAIIQLKDLQHMTLDLGAGQQRICSTGQQGAAMKGFFMNSSPASGLFVHAINAVELEDIESAVELSPCLSVNFIFSGQLEFSLGGRHYLTRPFQSSSLACSAILLNKPEVITRWLKKGRRVHKVNVLVQKDWLLQRCQSMAKRQQLTRLFENHGAVMQWEVDKALYTAVNTFFDWQNDESLSDQLRLEYKVIQLVSLTIDALLQQMSKRASESQVNSEYNAENLELTPYFLHRKKDESKLKALVDREMNDRRSLKDIAKSLGVSVSTLQRRFKSSYGTTVIDYIRQRRLEQAKAAMAIEGISIGEAAYLAGYNHTSNFITAFKKRFSLTPSELIQRHTNKV